MGQPLAGPAAGFRGGQARQGGAKIHVLERAEGGFHQVAPYFTYPGFHSMPVGDFTVRQSEWDKLPPDIKQILTTACREERP